MIERLDNICEHPQREMQEAPRAIWERPVVQRIGLDLAAFTRNSGLDGYLLS